MSLGNQICWNWFWPERKTIYFQPIAVAEHNACQVEVVITFIIAGIFNVEIEVSHDLENWTLPSTSSPWRQSVSAFGYTLLQNVTGLEASYVRVVLRASLFAAGNAMIGINLSQQ